MITRADKQKIRSYIMSYYAAKSPRDIRIGADGAVSVYVDEMPNTNQPGRIFAGWGADLLSEARARERVEPA